MNDARISRSKAYAKGRAFAESGGCYYSMRELPFKYGTRALIEFKRGWDSID